MHNTSYPYNFSDFSNNEMSMQNETRSIHMDIPAGEKPSMFEIQLACSLNLVYANFFITIHCAPRNFFPPFRVFCFRGEAFRKMKMSGRGE